MNMKRKLALLLALVMTLSLLPMNVFGANLQGQLPNTLDDDMALQTITMRFDLARLAPLMTRVGNEFRTDLIFELDTTMGDRTAYAMFGTSGGWTGNGIWNRPDVTVGQGTDWRGRVVAGRTTTGGAVNVVTNVPYFTFAPAQVLTISAGEPGWEVGPIADEHRGHASAIRTDWQNHGIHSMPQFAPSSGHAESHWPNPLRIQRISVPMTFTPPLDSLRFADGSIDPNMTATAFGLAGFVDVQVPIIVARDAIGTQIRAGHRTAGTNVLNWLSGWQDVVAGGRYTPGVTFELEGDALAFESGLILPPIIITERFAGSMAFRYGAAENVDRTIRLVAPYDYTWNVGIPGNIHMLNPDLPFINYSITLTPRNQVYAGAPIQGIVDSWGIVRETGGRRGSVTTPGIPQYPGIAAPSAGAFGTSQWGLSSNPLPAGSMFSEFEVSGGGFTPVQNRINTVHSIESDHRMYIEIIFPGTGHAAVVDGQPNHASLEGRRGGTSDADRASIGGIGIMALEGLALIPSVNAPEHHDVNIDISWGPARVEAWRATWGAGHGVLESAAAVMHTQPSRWWRDRWCRFNMQVGVRRDVALELGIAGSAPEIPSGLMGWQMTNQVGAFNNAGTWSLSTNYTTPLVRLDRFGEALWQGTRPALLQGGDPVNWSGTGTPAAIRTARVQVRELVAGALDTGFISSQISFNMPEGVQIMHSAFALHNNNGRYEPARGEINWTPVPAIGHQQLWHQTDWQGIHTGQIARNPFWQGVPHVTEDALHLFVPRNMNPIDLRMLEVYFWVSVEAGFEHKYGNELVVTVDGSGIQRLPEDNRTVVAAEIVDPIALELDGPMIQVDTGRTHNVMERTRLSDVVISEESHGRLRAGDEIWVYVQGTHIHRADTTLRFHTAPTAIVESGDLILGPVNTLRRVLPGGMEVTGISVRVNRASTSGNESVIRFTDNYLFGEVLPGNEYNLVVSGPRLAANEFQIAARAATAATQAITVQEWEPNPNFVEATATAATREVLTLAQVISTIQGNPTLLAAHAEFVSVMSNFALPADGNVWAGDGLPQSGWHAAWTSVQAEAFVRNAIQAAVTELGHPLHADSANIGEVAAINNLGHLVSWTAGNPVVALSVTGGGSQLNADNWPWRLVTRQILPGQMQLNGVSHQTLGVFDSLPYSVPIIEWSGAFVPPPEGDGPPQWWGRTSFTRHTMVNIDGHDINAIVFDEFGTRPNHALVTLMSARLFANFVGGETSWDAATRTATFNGYSRHGNLVTVELTDRNPIAIVNGEPVDIAEGAGQAHLLGRGSIEPRIHHGRIYVPARFLANQFGVPITSQGGGVDMTIILG